MTLCVRLIQAQGASACGRFDIPRSRKPAGRGEDRARGDTLEVIFPDSPSP